MTNVWHEMNRSRKRTRAGSGADRDTKRGRHDETSAGTSNQRQNRHINRRRDALERSKQQQRDRRRESPKPPEPYDNVKNWIEHHKRRYTEKNRLLEGYDHRIPTVESDCAIGAFDFEHYFDVYDSEEQAITEEFEQKNPTFRKSEEVCTHWLRGLCQFVDHECPNLHIYEPRLFPLCQFYIRGKGNCTNPDCIFRHPGDKQQVFCVDYARGFCKNGLHCDYKHKKLSADDVEGMRHHVDEAIQSHKRYRYENRQVLRERIYALRD